MRSTEGGLGAFWEAVTSPVAVASLRLTLLASLGVAAINAVAGTLIAWVLVRDRFRGKSLVNALIDLPFALPTILALLFVTLPFVVRSVQPVLLELDREMEEASTSLGASAGTTFRRIILPNLVPAVLSGTALAFARAVGEFGSVVLISGNIPFDTQVASVFVYSRIESDAVTSAAAVSVVLLVLSVLVLVAIRALGRFGARHEA